MDINFPGSQTTPTSQAITPDTRSSDVVEPSMQQNTTNPPALPPTVQEAVTKKQSNYLTWDQDRDVFPCPATRDLMAETDKRDAFQ
jgi:hypothetical protein